MAGGSAAGGSAAPTVGRLIPWSQEEDDMLRKARARAVACRVGLLALAQYREP